MLIGWMNAAFGGMKQHTYLLSNARKRKEEPLSRGNGMSTAQSAAKSGRATGWGALPGEQTETGRLKRTAGVPLPPWPGRQALLLSTLVV